MTITIRDLKGLVTYIGKNENTKNVLVVRTPYNAEKYKEWIENILIRTNSSVIVQDVRGRYKSKGEWVPYAFEIEDGVELINYASIIFPDIPIFMVGSSYEAYTARIAAYYNTKVSGLILRVGVRSQRDILYFREKLRLSDRVKWMLTHGTGKFSDFSAFHSLNQKNEEFWKKDISFYEEIMKINLDTLQAQKEDIVYPDCPVYLITGWKDGFLEGAVSDFKNWSNDDKSLIIGDWDHSLSGKDINKIRENEWISDRSKFVSSKIKVKYSDIWLERNEITKKQDQNKYILNQKINVAHKNLYSIYGDINRRPILSAEVSQDIVILEGEEEILVGVPYINYSDLDVDMYAQLLKINTTTEVISNLVLKKESTVAKGTPFAIKKYVGDRYILRISTTFHPILYNNHHLEESKHYKGLIESFYIGRMF